MIFKKISNQIFNNAQEIAKKFDVDLNLRPQNLKPELYYKLAKEFEDLRG